MKERWPVIPSRLSSSWRLSAGSVKLIVALRTKSFLRTTQQVQTKNVASLMKAVGQRSQGQPLVTVSNHASCLDDPVIWSYLPFSTHLSSKMRWTPAASEFVFTNSIFSWFFSRVQLVPITRGLGVYQRGLEYCLSLVNEGKWVHCFPEGKINMSLNQQQRLKWGVGRLLAEAVTTPMVIPIWHVGMDDVLPNKAPYIPRLFKVNKTSCVFIGCPLMDILTSVFFLSVFFLLFSSSCESTVISELRPRGPVPGDVGIETILLAHEEESHAMADVVKYSFSCSLATDKNVYAPEEPVQFLFTLTNNNDCDLYVLNWHTPLEGMWNRYLQVSVGGTDIPYRGIMAKRGPPSAESYILVPAGETVSASVDMLKGYSTETLGRYSVLLSTALMDVVERKEGVEFLANQFADMTQVPIACGPVEFDVVS